MLNNFKKIARKFGLLRNHSYIYGVRVEGLERLKIQKNKGYEKYG